MFIVPLRSDASLSGPLRETEIAAYLQRHTPIIIFSASDDTRLGLQLDQVETVEDLLSDRHGAILIDTDRASPLGQTVEHGDFSVIAIGPDGAPGLRCDRLVGADELLAATAPAHGLAAE